jgi:thioredoxin 1
MKIMILSTIAFFCLTVALALEPAANHQKSEHTGISFFDGSWAEALKLAKEENKLVFLDIYATWCGPCKRLKANTFPDLEVGNFYNANFINLALDGEKGEGLELACVYEIKGYPTLLFIDHTGTVVTRTAGYHNPHKFLKLGKSVKDRK